jgi:hypothetical protein
MKTPVQINPGARELLFRPTRPTFTPVQAKKPATSVENLNRSFPPSPQLRPLPQGKSDIESQSPPTTKTNDIAWPEGAASQPRRGNSHRDSQTDSPFLSQAKSNVQKLKGYLDESAQSNAENSLSDVSTVFAAVNFEDSSNVRLQVQSFRRANEVFFIPEEEEVLQMIQSESFFIVPLPLEH